MAELVYLLCACTSSVCAALLIRSFLSNRKVLLLWSSLCFVGLSLNNILLFVDLVVIPGVNFELVRTIVALLAVCMLLYGLLMEAP